MLEKNDLLHPLGPVMKQRTEWDGFRSLPICLLVQKGLRVVYLVKPMRDINVTQLGNRKKFENDIKIIVFIIHSFCTVN